MAHPQLPDELPHGIYDYCSPSGDFRSHFDTEEIDFWVECHEDADPEDIAYYLDQLVFRFGLELIDEDEAPYELKPNGIQRLYLSPVVPMDDTAPASNRGAIFGAGALVTGALAFLAAVANGVGPYLPAVAA